MKKMSAVAAVWIMVLCLLSPALAHDEVRTGEPVGGRGPIISAAQDGGWDSHSIDSTVHDITEEIAPSVSVSDLQKKIEAKGGDIVVVLQTVGKYICIGAFVFCCMFVVLGLVGNQRNLVAGVLGLIVSGVAYAGIVCGREIVLWIASWAAN